MKGGPHVGRGQNPRAEWILAPHKPAQSNVFLAERAVLSTWECLKWSICLIAIVRTVGPAFRIANFLTGIYLIVLSRFGLDQPLVFRYNIFLADEGTSVAHAFVANACLVLWVLDYCFLAMAHFFTFTKASVHWSWFDSVTGGYQPHHVLSSLLYGLWVFTVAAVGIVSTHTFLSHAWRVRNVWFASLLLSQCFNLVVSSVSDTIEVGSQWGTPKASRVASVLTGLRIWVLLPMIVIFSVAFAALL
jgi:hypothetical protein